MAESYGWTGKILRVDLTTGEITTQDDAKYHKYIGGMGMAYRIMYEEAPMELDPYDEKALVIFGVGPLTGAGVPCSGRMNVTFRSTWSKGHSIIDAHMGGHIGSMLKYAGYDGIVVSGISEKPVYLRIEDGEVSLEDASEIWGKGTFAANKWMVEQNGREFETASIGPAGENLVDYSTLNTSFGNSGGAGLGAAMGNKKLKGLAIRGTGSVKVADPKKVLELQLHDGQPHRRQQQPQRPRTAPELGRVQRHLRQEPLVRRTGPYVEKGSRRPRGYRRAALQRHQQDRAALLQGLLRLWRTGCGVHREERRLLLLPHPLLHRV